MSHEIFETEFFLYNAHLRRCGKTLITEKEFLERHDAMSKRGFEEHINDKREYMRENYGQHDSFYESGEWRRVRFEALLKSKRCCTLCGARDRLHVDHIKPKSKYPELSLDINNLQVLCADCNLGKGNRDETDFRK